MATKGVLCKYHMNGLCKYGDKCLFSHDKQDLPNSVCTYYLAGCCAYGDKCRYNHVRPDWSKEPTPPSNYTPPMIPKPPISDEAPALYGAGPDISAKVTVQLRGNANPWKPASAQSSQFAQAVKGGDVAPISTINYSEWEADPNAYGADDQGYTVDQGYYIADTGCHYYNDGQADGYAGAYDTCSTGQYTDYAGYATYVAGYTNGEGGYEEGSYQTGDQGYEGDVSYADANGYEEGAAEEESWEGPQGTMTDPADLPLCQQYCAHGSCSRGDYCTLIHGHECEICNKYALHPYNQTEAEAHTRQCRARHDKLAARLRSANVECCICLERVLGKADPKERKFGLMFCEHAFCLDCIRNWRNTDEADVDTALRTCPVCRTSTHFVTPSSVWPASSEEKAAIVDGYKRSLATRHCRNFNFGEGKCPFGSSCFYRHEYRDGKLEEAVLRKVGTADGEVRVMKPLSLASFLDTPQAQRLLQRRRR